MGWLGAVSGGRGVEELNHASFWEWFKHGWRLCRQPPPQTHFSERAIYTFCTTLHTPWHYLGVPRHACRCWQQNLRAPGRRWDGQTGSVLQWWRAGRTTMLPALLPLLRNNMWHSIHVEGWDRDVDKILGGGQGMTPACQRLPGRALHPRALQRAVGVPTTSSASCFLTTAS